MLVEIGSNINPRGLGKCRLIKPVEHHPFTFFHRKKRKDRIVWIGRGKFERRGLGLVRHFVRGGHIGWGGGTSISMHDAGYDVLWWPGRVGGAAGVEGGLVMASIAVRGDGRRAGYKAGSPGSNNGECAGERVTGVDSPPSSVIATSVAVWSGGVKGAMRRRAATTRPLMRYS